MVKRHRKIEVEGVDQPEPPKPPSVPLAVFAASCGVKQDQLAGFKAWARNEGPRPMGDWRALLAKFCARPTR